jgi:hypothetical protein
VEVGSLLTRALEVVTVLKMESRSVFDRSLRRLVHRAVRALLPLLSRCCRGHYGRHKRSHTWAL